MENSPILKFEDSEGNLFNVPANEAGEFARECRKEGKVVRGVTEMGDADAAGNPWSAENVWAGIKGVAVDPTGQDNPLAYMGKNLLKGIGTAAGTVLGAIPKTWVGLFGGTLQAGMRLGEDAVGAISGNVDHSASDKVGEVKKGFTDMIDLFTPNFFDENNRLYRGVRQSHGYGLKLGQLDEGQRREILSGKGISEEDFAKMPQEEKDKLLWEDGGYLMDDEYEVRANRAQDVVNKDWLGLLANLRYGLGSFNKAAQIGSSAKAAHVGTAAAFGAERFADMATDENGPGGAIQEVASLADGAINTALFTLGTPFAFGKKMMGTSPFAKETAWQVAKRFMVKANASGMTMAADTAAKEGVEAAAGAVAGERWNPKTWQEVTKSVVTEYLVGFGAHSIDAADEAARNRIYGRKYRGMDANEQQRHAPTRTVDENRKAYCPVLNLQALRVRAAHEMGIPFVKGTKGTENVSGMGLDGSVMFDDGSVYRPEREWVVSDSNGNERKVVGKATITTSDGCIMDAATGDVVGVAANGTTWESGQKTAEEKYHATRSEGSAPKEGVSCGSPDWDANMPGEVMDFICAVKSANDDFASWKVQHDAWDKDPNRDEVTEPTMTVALPDRGKLTPDAEAWIALAQLNRLPDESAHVAKMAMQDVVEGRKTIAEAYKDAKDALGIVDPVESGKDVSKSEVEKVGSDPKPEIAVATGTEARNDTPLDPDVKGAENTAVFLDLANGGKLPVHEDCEVAGLQVGDGWRLNGEHAEPEASGIQEKPVVVWIGKDGTRELICGARRVEAARKAGEKTVKAVYVLEQDGWSRESARGINTLDNLRDHNGDILDRVRAFEQLGIGSLDDLDRQGVNVGTDVWMNWALNIKREAGPKLMALIRGEADPSVGRHSLVEFAKSMVGRINMATAGEKRDRLQEIVLDEIVGKMDVKEGREAINALMEKIDTIDLDNPKEVGDAIAEGRKRAAGETGVVADAEPVVTPDGKVKPLAEVKAEHDAGAPEEAPKPVSETPALDGAEGSAMNRGVELKAGTDGVMGCARFPNVRVQVSREGVVVEGLDVATMTKQENLEDLSAFLTNLASVSDGKRVMFADPDVAACAGNIMRQVYAEGMIAFGKERAEVQGQLVENLAKGSGVAVHRDPESWEKVHNEAGAHNWINSKYENYGCMWNGEVYLNPTVFDLNTPIHEYGHLALELMKGRNDALIRRGLDLARQDKAMMDMLAADEVYGKKSEAERAEEVLVRLIGDRGETIVKEKGIGERFQAWLKEFWAQFRNGIGIEGISEEEVERMTLGEIADAIHAEMQSGRSWKAVEKPKQSVEKNVGENAPEVSETSESVEASAPESVERKIASMPRGSKEQIKAQRDYFKQELERVKAYMRRHFDIDRKKELGSKFLAWDNFRKTKGTIPDYVEIKVPGDGQIKVKNNPDGIALLEKFGKTFVVRTKSIPGGVRVPATPSLKVSDARASVADLAKAGESVLKTAAKEKRIDDMRKPFTTDGKNVCLTDGRLVFIKDKAVGAKGLKKSTLTVERAVGGEADAGTETTVDAVELWSKLGQANALVDSSLIRPKIVHYTGADGKKSPLSNEELEYNRSVDDLECAHKLSDEDGMARILISPEGKIGVSAVRTALVERNGKAVLDYNSYATEEDFTGWKMMGACDINKMMTLLEMFAKDGQRNLKFSVILGGKVFRLEGNGCRGGLAIPVPNDAIGTRGMEAAGLMGGPMLSRAVFPNGEPYVHVDVDQHLFDGKNPSEQRKVAQRVIIDKFRNKVIGDGGARAFVQKEAAKEYGNPARELPGQVYEAKLRTSPELDNLLATSKFIGHNADDGRHPKAVGGWDHYEAVFEVGGKYYVGRVSLLVDDRGRRRFYDVTQIKEEPLSQVARATTQGRSAGAGIPAHKVLQGQNPATGSSDAVILPNSPERGQGGLMPARPVGGGVDPNVFSYAPGAKIVAMGDTEGKDSGLAAAIEKKGALRPWTMPDSPCANAKPIAFDAADLIMLWRKVTDSKNVPTVQEGSRIWGHRSAIGLNRGGYAIDIVSKLFGTIDAGDVARMRREASEDGFFNFMKPEWCASRTLDEIVEDRRASLEELDRRVRKEFEKRVKTGAGGNHYAAQVLGHEIGHTLHWMPEGENLGPVIGAARDLAKAMTHEFRIRTGKEKIDGANLRQEIENLIAWWHGTDTCPNYYAKDGHERFAELFGIFLTQPESVAQHAPRTYDTCVRIIAKNPKLKRAYDTLAAAKWDGKADDTLTAELEKTWTEESDRQYAELDRASREKKESKWDRFSYALNDRFGPMFSISKRGIKAEEEHLKKAVAEGAMSPAEMKDRLDAMTRDVDALKTSLYDFQRGSGGSTRLMIADFDDVMRMAEKSGVNWRKVRLYAHLMRVIELGGRATAHGVDPSRAAKLLDKMQEQLGEEAYANVEKTWKAFRAVYEKHVLEDGNVAELFDEGTMKFLMENKHYVTMQHRMTAEQSAEWKEKLDAYRAGNKDAADPCLDIYMRLNKWSQGNAHGEGFTLHKLTGSFAATVDPIAATMKRAIEIKEAAQRNHLVRQLSETLRSCGVKGVMEVSEGQAVKNQNFGTLSYMLDGKRHTLVVPRVIYDGFVERPAGMGGFGATMRFLRNTMTLWNPAFINRAYLIDKSSLETNIEGLHKAPVDVLSEALCWRGIGVPVYMVNNYLARFTPISETWVGKLLWNEHTVNHYAHRAQKIAKIVYEGKFSDRLEEAKRLRSEGRTGEAAEIEQNVMIAREMMAKNVFQSQYQFNLQQKGQSTDDILRQYGYRIEGSDVRGWRARMWETAKAGGRVYNRFEEEQEAVTKIIAYLYQVKTNPGGDADARARLAIEQGGTPNLAARGVWATYVENATGFFWNVRKEGTLRTWRALVDHPKEWVTKNLAQTAAPAVLKGLIATGGLRYLIKHYLFDDDEKRMMDSNLAGVVEFADFTNAALKKVPGYYQRNYNVIPIAKFGDAVVSMRVKYSPEEFAIQNAIHTAFQMLGKDPTDPDADWSDLTRGVWEEFLPNIFGRNYALDAVATFVGPMLGVNPYDVYRGRNVYDKDTWEAGMLKPGHFLKAVGRNFWNYSPLGTFGGSLKDTNYDRRGDESELPGWIDAVLSTPFLKMLPASMLTVTSGTDTFTRALKREDDKLQAAARITAHEIFAECIKRDSLGGFQEGLKELDPGARMMAVRHVINAWRQYKADPRREELKRIRSIKDTELKRRAWQYLNEAQRFQD